MSNGNEYNEFDVNDDILDFEDFEDEQLRRDEKNGLYGEYLDDCN